MDKVTVIDLDKFSSGENGTLNLDDSTATSSFGRVSFTLPDFDQQLTHYRLLVSTTGNISKSKPVVTPDYTLRILNNEDLMEEIRKYEEIVDMSSAELIRRWDEGTAPNSFEAKLLRSLLRFVDDNE